MILQKSRQNKPAKKTWYPWNTAYPHKIQKMRFFGLLVLANFQNQNSWFDVRTALFPLENSVFFVKKKPLKAFKKHLLQQSECLKN